MFTWSYYEITGMLQRILGEGSHSALVLSFLITLLQVVGLYKIFIKANQPGVIAIIPFYNSFMLFKIAMGTGWLFLVQFIPFIGILADVLLAISLSRAFKKGSGYSLGLLFIPVIFYPLLGFSKDIYYGPFGFRVADPSSYNNQQATAVDFTDANEDNVAVKAKTPIVVEVEAPDDTVSDDEAKVDVDTLTSDDLSIESHTVIDVEDVTVEDATAEDVTAEDKTDRES